MLLDEKERPQPLCSFEIRKDRLDYLVFSDRLWNRERLFHATVFSHSFRDKDKEGLLRRFQANDYFGNSYSMEHDSEFFNSLVDYQQIFKVDNYSTFIAGLRRIIVNASAFKCLQVNNDTRP